MKKVKLSSEPLGIQLRDVSLTKWKWVVGLRRYVKTDDIESSLPVPDTTTPRSAAQISNLRLSHAATLTFS